jgi:hypothetical protein
MLFKTTAAPLALLLAAASTPAFIGLRFAL